jgi:hypothetical protein
MAGFFECISRFLQSLAHSPFGGLCPVLDGLASGARCVLDGFPGLCSGLLDGFPSLFNRTLILRTHPEGYAE